MNILEFQKTVADLLNGVEWFQKHGCNVLAEDLKDIDAEAARSLESVGLCGVVMTPSLESTGADADGAIIWEVSQLVISFQEIVPVNRLRDNYVSALDCAVRAAKELNGPSIQVGTIKQTAVGDQLIVELACSTNAQLEGE